MTEKTARQEIVDTYPLSPMQEGMLFHSLFEQQSPMYIEQLACTLTGALDPVIFLQAWKAVVRHHAILRTSFSWRESEQMRQIVHRDVQLPFIYGDWGNWSSAEKERRLADIRTADRRKGFDLDKAPLMRFALYRWDEESWRFLWTHHHLLLDGWSLPIVLEDFCSAYESLVKGEQPRAVVARPYREYIDWCDRQSMANAEIFWRKALDGFRGPTPLGMTQGPFNIEGDQAETRKETVTLSPAETVSLQEFCKREHLTVNTLVQCAYAVLVSRYGRERDIVFGVTVSGRPGVFADADRMVGMFINTLPLRVHVLPHEAVRELLHRIQNSSAEMRQWEYSPLAKVQTWSSVPRGTPLFHSILVFENYPLDPSLFQGVGGVSVTDIVAEGDTNYPLAMVAAIRGALSIEAVYKANLFDAQTMHDILEQMRFLLAQIVAAPAAPADTLSLVRPEEKEVIIARWNRAERNLPEAGIPVHTIFERRVAAAPDKTALEFQGQAMSYAELNRRANNLARFLQMRGIGPEKLVGVFLERSFDMIVAVLGTLKAGAGYVPLDPEYPRERLAFMMDDTTAGLILTQASLADRLSFARCNVVLLDKGWETIQQTGDENPTTTVQPENIAYVIYTSGSTGKPKGVAVSHKGLSNFVCAHRSGLSIDSTSRIFQFASLSFDASVSEIFAALTSGGTLQLAPYELVRSVDELTKCLAEGGTSHVTLPPTILAALKEEDFPNLKCVISAGEACSADLASRWTRGRRFVNAYGPTETTVGATWNCEMILPAGRPTFPIGRPMTNIRVYVLDENFEPVPAGVTGELFVGGVGVSRGYLGRPESTAEKFLPDLYGNDPGARLYRTGDLGRVLSDGTLEFVGRSDRQVKARGIRIEPGEVESQLRLHPKVKDGAVDVRSDGTGERRLVAYVVPVDRQAISPRDLRAFLGERLPAFLVPDAYVFRDALPLGPSGKIDLSALPDPTHRDIRGESPGVRPRSATEELLAGIWSEILGVDGIAATDNFFELGGHSLRVTQLLSRIRETFALELPLRTVFQTPSLEGLALVIDQKRNAGGEAALLPPLTPESKDGDAPLSYCQQRLWFLEQLEPGNPTYNIPASFRISGPLQVDLLQECVTEIVSRHDILRTRFVKRQGEAFQHVEDRIDVPVSVTDLTALPRGERDEAVLRMAGEDARRSFDLEHGPLFSFSVLRCSDDDHVVLLTLHHIIADGWSIGILIREISSLYKAKVEGGASELPRPTVQYADYARWQRSWLGGDTLATQIAYWKHQLENVPTFLDLPLDHARPSIQSSRGMTVAIDFPPEFKTALENMCREAGVTLYMVLLSAYAALLHRYSRQDAFAIGSPVANRRLVQTENLIGFFVNTLVLPMGFRDGMTVRQLLLQTRETCLDAFAHQDLPFEKLVEALQPARDTSRSPLFQAAFVHQNYPQESLQIADLTFIPLNLETGTSKFDVTLTTVDTEDGLRADLEFNTDIFKASTATRLLRHFSTLVQQFVVDIDQQVDEIPLLDKRELQTILVERNQTEASFPGHLCVQEWFENEVRGHPDSAAILCGSSCLTYHDLNCRANQLAWRLRSLGVGPETLVGLCFDRCPEMIIAIFGVLKAGGAFVPLDPTYPKDRLAYMLEDSRVPVVLSHGPVANVLPENGFKTFFLEGGADGLAGESRENLPSLVVPDSLAYVIYTSGSTGRPKGTMLHHRGLCNLAAAQKATLGVGPGSRILQFASLSFDASVWEVVMALLSGGTLVVAPRDVLSSGLALADLLREDNITNVTLPPSVLAVVPRQDCPHLETIITAGERCPRELVDHWGRERTFVNAYGPTETTVCASMHRCAPDLPNDPPIGTPIANTQLFVVDDHLRPVPDGVAGELLIGGVGLARGYLGKPDLTAEKFIPSPFGPDSGARLYRSGDQCRYLSSGLIEYLGRMDQQVKVRGFRIEPGEIEALLDSHPMVKEAVVLVREDSSGEGRLVAYLVAHKDSYPAVSDLKRFLRRSLPEYMVPSAFVILDAFPLSPAGKVDRRALPAPDPLRRDVDSTYVPPRTPVESVLAEHCAQLLGLEKVGTQDSFFDLGGHSLLATKFMSRIHDAYHVDLPLRTIFESPTIRELAEKIEATSKLQQNAALQIEEKLDEIGHLSEIEVNALLEEMKKSIAGNGVHHG